MTMGCGNSNYWKCAPVKLKEQPHHRSLVKVLVRGLPCSPKGCEPQVPSEGGMEKEEQGKRERRSIPTKTKIHGYAL